MKRLLSGSLLVSLRVAATAAPAQTPFGQRQLRATGDPFAVARFPATPGNCSRPAGPATSGAGCGRRTSCCNRRPHGAAPS
jgi:hypothetical protein